MGFKLDSFKELTQVSTIQNTSLGVMDWGAVNAFPQTLKNLIEQSPNSKAAVDRVSQFYKGEGFVGEGTIVNKIGMTLKEVVSAAADDLSMFEGFGIQCNYNIKGQVTSMTPMTIPTLRFKEVDELYYANKLGYHHDFAANAEVRRNVRKPVTKSSIKWFDRFHPEMVLAQIENAGKISKYNGQILYYSNAGMSKYPVPRLQSLINYVLSDVENSILVRKETATGFISSYLLKTTMDREDPTLIAMQTALEEAQGARGYGKIVVFAGLSQEEIAGTLLEEIGGGGADSRIIDSATKTYELDKMAISGAYLIPPILTGADQKTGFTSSELEDAYYIMNANTQGGRDIIGSNINRILAASVFNIEPIKINKLKLDKDEEGDNIPVSGQPTEEGGEE